MSATALALPAWLDPSAMITGFRSWAVVGIMAILFAECGLLIGFFLPGDTLLFLGGLLLASAGGGLDGITMNPAVFIAVLAMAAFAGNMTGYAIGGRLGPALFTRPDA